MVEIFRPKRYWFAAAVSPSVIGFQFWVKRGRLECGWLPCYCFHIATIYIGTCIVYTKYTTASHWPFWYYLKIEYLLYLLSLGAKNAFFPLKTAAFFTLSSCNIGVLLLWLEQTSFVDLFFIELEIISAYFFIQRKTLKNLCDQFLGKLFHHCVSTNTLHHYKYCDDSYILWLTLSKFLLIHNFILGYNFLC